MLRRSGAGRCCTKPGAHTAHVRVCRTPSAERRNAHGGRADSVVRERRGVVDHVHTSLAAAAAARPDANLSAFLKQFMFSFV